MRNSYVLGKVDSFQGSSKVDGREVVFVGSLTHWKEGTMDRGEKC